MYVYHTEDLDVEDAACLKCNSSATNNVQHTPLMSFIHT